MKRNIFQTIGNAAEKAILSRVKNNTIFAEYYKRGKNGAPWKRQSLTYSKKEIKDWTNAVMTATDPENPRRADLMRFNQSLLLDLHLASVIDTRILRVQRSSYKIVNEKGEENEELKALLERPWYDDLVRLTVGKTFQGTTLIELFDTNEEGELLRVSEIPQSNFLPHKGIIINEEWDDNGTSYIEGTYKDYYVQVGNAWELGMLNELAMIVLAKKLGLGSWMGYIEKLGIPPIFAITERMDPGRRDELFEMLENFKSNHFAVLQGNEKIEIPNNLGNDAFNSFKSLINDICNKELSKRVLGGSAMVDEKSFVGSAEVQERVAQDRHEADKLLFKYYFNTQIRQRLAKISSLYAGFASHTLVWDNQETLDINGYIDAVQKLSSAFDFDIEEVKNRTGLPIIGTKTLNSDTGIPNSATKEDKTDSQKKKTSANLKGLAPYAHVTPDFVIFSATWDAAIERLADQIYSGEVKPSDLDKDLVLKNYAAFNKEAEKAWGEGYYDESLTRNFRENFLKFAGAKSYDLMQQLKGLNMGDISKEAFVEKAKGVVNRHNSAYLTAEKRFCNSAVHSAQDYKGFIDDIDVYPNLKYRNFKDGASRDSHAANDGIIKPVEAWRSLPPYDHNCRCWLEQTDEPATSGRSLKNTKFNNNPYKTGKVYTDEQAYFEKVASSGKKGVIHDNTESMKAYMPYNQNIKAGDHKVFVNDFSDKSDTNLSIIAAKKLAPVLKKDIYILPHINSESGIKNPEIGIGKPSTLADLKSWDIKKTKSTRSLIKNGIKSAGKQKCKWVVFDLTESKEKDFLEKAANKLHGELAGKHKPTIEQIVLIKSDKVLKVSRSQINNSNYLDYFKMD